jgi:hypothetical protein
MALVSGTRHESSHWRDRDERKAFKKDRISFR